MRAASQWWRSIGRRRDEDAASASASIETDTAPAAPTKPPAPDSVNPSRSISDSALTSMSLANALLVVPEDRTTVAAGEQLSALLLGEDASLSETFAL